MAGAAAGDNRAAELADRLDSILQVPDEFQARLLSTGLRERFDDTMSMMCLWSHLLLVRMSLNSSCSRAR